MRFNDGFWRQTPGLRTIHPATVHDVEIGNDMVLAYLPTRPITNRRNTINNPVAELRIWSPAENILGVRVTHLTGRQSRGPAFVLEQTGRLPLCVERSLEELIVRSGEVSLHLSLQGEPTIAFKRRGELLTAADRRGIGIAQGSDGLDYLFQRLIMPEGDLIYGLGERSTPLVKNGQVVETWNDDGGPSSWHSYKAIPFFVSNRGWAVFVNSPGPASFEIGTEFVSQVQFSIPGHELEYFLIGGENMKDVVSRYTGLVGRPALPPRWSFGLWLSTSFVTDYDEATVTEFVEGMAARNLPLSVVHFDCFWMREFHWCDFKWDRKAFPDPEGMLTRLHARGLRCCVWINPYIAQRSSLFEEAKQAGYLLRDRSGNVWQWDTWQAGMAFVDFTNPAARTWFAEKLQALLEMGVDCFKTDFGERLPLDAVYQDGSDAALMHNFYAYLYNETVFSTLRKVRGEADAVVFARSATVGSQRFPVHWGGDPEPTFVSMAETLRSGLSLSLSGFGFWSHDIGGFEGDPSPELFMRWAAFGPLSSHSRLHGSVGHRVPWRFGDNAVEVVRKFTQLKMRLMPYIDAAAREAHTTGIPLLRAMVLEFDNDPNCAHLDRQYMLGPDLLVAPVMRPDGQVRFYLPAGEWTELLTGKTICGPVWRDEVHGHESLPLLVRGGAIIATGARDDTPEYDYRDSVVLEVFGARTNFSVRELAIAGIGDEPDARFSIEIKNGTVFAASDSPLPWSILLVGESSAEPIGDTEARCETRGTIISPASQREYARARLSGMN